MARRTSPAEAEAPPDVSVDLAYELQSKFFDQLAAMSLAGAGLTITLASSLLSDEPLVWIATVEFAVGAVIALVANQQLIDAIFDRKAVRRRNRNMTMLALLFLGMGVGSLGAQVALGKKLGGPPAAGEAARAR